MESVILTVRQLMIDGKARIIPPAGIPLPKENASKKAPLPPNPVYSENEAVAAFNRVAEQHGWMKKSHVEEFIRKNGQKKKIFVFCVILVCFTTLLLCGVLWYIYFT